MRSRAPTKHQRSILLTGICLLAIAATVLGCGWEIGTEHSVRFNPYRSEKEFGQLPPLPKYERSKANKLFTWEDNRKYDWDREDDDTKHIEMLWDAADKNQAEEVWMNCVVLFKTIWSTPKRSSIRGGPAQKMFISGATLQLTSSTRLVRSTTVHRKLRSRNI